MRPEKIILKNFLAYEHLEYTFQRRPIQIQGENLTDDNQQTNGACKSGILNAIEFALTGMNSRGVRDAELVNFDHTSAEIWLYLSCNVRKEMLEIHWTINTKGSNVLALAIKKDGESVWNEVDFSNVLDGKKAILDWVDISKEDLFNYYIISKERFKSFFKANNKENIELINRFSDASVIDGLELSLNTDISNLETKLNAEADKIKANNGMIEANKAIIARELERDLEQEADAERSSILASIEALKGDKDSLYEKIEAAEAEAIEETAKLVKLDDTLKEASDAVSAFKPTDFSALHKDVDLKIDKLNEKGSLLQADINSKSESSKKAAKVMSDIEKALNGLTKCPKCGYEWDESKAHSEEQLAEFRAKMPKIKELSAKIDEEIKTIEAAYQKSLVEKRAVRDSTAEIEKQEREESAKLRKLNSAVKEIVDSKDAGVRAIEKIQRDIKSWNMDISDINEGIAARNEKLKAIKKERNSALIKELEDDNETIEALNSSIVKACKEIEDEIFGYNVWKENFKKFKMYVANQSLGIIQYHCNNFLKEMGVDMRIRLDGMRYKADGSIKEEITAVIIRRIERTFGSFSGGEKGRLVFASILANKRMIDSTHKYGGLDFLGIDEIFEGVDALGMKFIMKSVKDFDATILVITHVSDEFLDNNTIKIVKENDKARLVTGG